MDYLHVWLADGSNNHCECENCQKARPSDFYLMIMNELDEILTERRLSTRIVFIVYVDGSQRSFFLNGLAMTVYAETLLNRNSDFDALCDDYFGCAYGSVGSQVRDYLQKVSDLFDFSFVSGEKTTDPKRGDHYNPERAKALAAARELAEEGRKIAQQNWVMPWRCQTLSMGLLLRHAEYIEGIAAFLAEKAQVHDAEALQMLDEFRICFGRYEVELERYF